MTVATSLRVTALASWLLTGLAHAHGAVPVMKGWRRLPRQGGWAAPMRCWRQ